ncbi:hypothetical protein CANARDRAFT_21041 [[Candida] arabinofermentans NRRL YB-2248]|uniref:Uncharacterized protein n=1 Tax=[Candida] arabinofermentans NRRL YB-2248 TaxID=983967 RepID=A0A1E4T5S8_9ASCO|nr:hypothetical protein CANARDRAFT_21041 [[Candida] arabinofermentans NRRL YB-2248]
MSPTGTQSCSVSDTITELTSTEYSDGKVAVKKGSGLIKIRKGQPEEDYIEQRDQFWKTGPVLNTNDWLVDCLNDQILYTGTNAISLNDESDDQQRKQNGLHTLDKIERDRVLKGLERLFYLRNYSECIKNCELLLEGLNIDENTNLESKENKTLKTMFKELNVIRTSCMNKVEQTTD